MVARGAKIPEKLTHDAIVEVILEVRFETNVLTELILGRIADASPWQAMTQRRLPAYEMPAQVRQMEPLLRYTPIFELNDAGDTPRALRIGPRVLSYHRTKKYVGWEQFRPELDQVVDVLFSAAKGLKIERLGLRYINALTDYIHGIESIESMDMKLTVAGESLVGNVNMNFSVEVDQSTSATVRIATPDFVKGTGLPDGAKVFVDVDVFTKPDVSMDDAADVKQWIVKAHEAEKVEFFHLLTQGTIDHLTEN